MADMDLSGYLTRIGFDGPVRADLDTLSAIVAAHNRSIPFENLDPVLGIPVADLSAEALTAKLVGRRRGGYCYEHNGLLGYVLEEIGFGVDRLAGRVVWMRPADAPLPAQTHNVLSVTVPGVDGRYLVDVGFGGQTLTSPIRLEAGPVQQTRHEPYRLTREGDDHVLAAQIRGEWQPLYTFTTAPRPRIDLEVGSWYVSTHPGSHFVTGLTAAVVTDEARHNLRGRNLAIHRPGDTERIRFDTAAQVLDALAGTFGINLADVADVADVDVEARIAAVLDS
ncbi:arylamine N-acetyltransferase [Mycolicibacterium goodii]|uniref:arylamine N-acetyltransferase family protein n=1 Tax=Mycolicibacterium goodii TaxID=134601 RepID=UPI001BDD705B|nr:arylamine N-acetyltransferase [Mycolicibacterium goodii]MBU8814552.1 arylamine N-acetyltransferase [Mycolicibacterium goodii]